MAPSGELPAGERGDIGGYRNKLEVGIPSLDVGRHGTVGSIGVDSYQDIGEIQVEQLDIFFDDPPTKNIQCPPDSCQIVEISMQKDFLKGPGPLPIVIGNTIGHKPSATAGFNKAVIGADKIKRAELFHEILIMPPLLPVGILPLEKRFFP